MKHISKHMFVLVAFMSTAVRADVNLYSIGNKLCEVLTKLCDIEPKLPCNHKKVITQADIPFTISEPGSYCVAEDLEPAQGQDANTPLIRVESSNVILDLNSHLLCGKELVRYVIEVTNVAGVEIFNGLLKDAGAGDPVGPALRADGSGHFFHDLVIDTIEGGVFLVGSNVLVKNVLTHNCDIGFVDSSGSNNCFVDCIAKNGSLSGFQLEGVNGLVLNSVAACNFSHGVNVIQESAVVAGCSITNNGTDGVLCATNNAIIKDCVCNNNGPGGSGIRVASSSTNNHIINNICNNNQESGGSRGYGVENEGDSSNDIWSNFAINNTGDDLVSTNSSPNFDGVAPLVLVASIADNPDNLVADPNDIGVAENVEP